MFQDPILSMKPASYSEQNQRTLDEIREENQRLSQSIDEMNRRRMNQGQQLQTPVWDEIDGIERGMTDAEHAYLSANSEYQESAAAIQAILQREYLRIMRPVVENTKDGKDALEKHLTLVKRLRKSAKDEAGKRYALMDEYMSGYRQMTFDEFLKMKGIQQ